VDKFKTRFGPLAQTGIAKYNQLLRIEEQLGDTAVYGGSMFKYRENV